MRRWISIVLTIMMIGGMITAVPSVASAAEIDMIPTGLCLDQARDDVAAVITYDNSSTSEYSGTVELARTEENAIIEHIRKIDVLYDNKNVITIEPHDITATGDADNKTAINGYYAVTFMTEDNREVYLTGLTPDNADTLQAQIIEGYRGSHNFTLESVDLIDAEKTFYEGSDDNMCWAAAVSNTLHYTGWGKKAGFQTNDDLFDLFAESFIDSENGNFPVTGYSWFFNGVLGVNFMDYKGSAAPKDNNSGAYLTDYDYGELVEEYTVSDGCMNSFQALKDRLHEGCGIFLSVGYTDVEGNSYGGHALSCWGYAVNKNHTPDEKEYLDALIVTDSDSDPTHTPDRRTAPNKIEILRLEPLLITKDGQTVYDTWWSKDYGNETVFAAWNFMTTIKPYSEDLIRETDEKATKSLQNDTDFSITDIRIANACGVNDGSVVSSYTDVFLSPEIFNKSNPPFSGTLSYHTVIRNSQGETVIDRNDSLTSDISGFLKRTSADYNNIGRLSPGVYTATVTVNPDKALLEAYYYNNSFQKTFTVTDDAPDLGNVALKLNYAYCDNTKIIFNPVFENTEELLDDGTTMTVYSLTEDSDFAWVVSYLEECNVTYGTDDPKLPVSIAIPNGNRIRISLKFETEKGVFWCDGGLFDVNYPAVEIETELQCGEEGNLSAIPYGAKGFINNESIAITVKDVTKGDHDPIKGSFTVIAEDDDENRYILASNIQFSFENDSAHEPYVLKDFGCDPLKPGTYQLSLAAYGDFTCENPMYLTEITVTNSLLGDADGDKNIAILDATAIQRTLVSLPVSFFNEVAADVDGDGEITIVDAAYIQRWLASLTSPQGIGKEIG